MMTIMKSARRMIFVLAAMAATSFGASEAKAQYTLHWGADSTGRYYLYVNEFGIVAATIRTAPNSRVNDFNGGYYYSIDSGRFPYGTWYFVPPAPEIVPGSAAGAITLMVGGVLLLTNRRRLQSPASPVTTLCRIGSS